jgi:hypothetical protein
VCLERSAETNSKVALKLSLAEELRLKGDLLNLAVLQLWRLRSPDLADALIGAVMLGPGSRPYYG